MTLMDDENKYIDWASDDQVAWVWQGGYDYEFEVVTAGMTMVGETVVDEDVDGERFTRNIPVGFKIHDFEEFWSAYVEDDQGMLDMIMRYVGEDPDRVLFLAKRNRDDADAIVNMWVHYMLDSDVHAFDWMTRDPEFL